MLENEKYWYAVSTRPRWEKKVAQLLNDAGIENYCPLNKVIRQWRDRKRIILEPIFKSYVFVKIKESDKWNLRKVNGILNFVYWLGKPARIREEEISNIRNFLNEFSEVSIQSNNDFQLNEIIKVKRGVLMNYQGILLELHGNIAKVRIESMGIQLYASVDKRNIEPLQKK